MKTLYLSLLSLLLSPLLTASPATALASPTACSSALRGPIRHVSALPPYRSSQLPGKGWVPIAIDKRFVLTDQHLNVNGKEAQPIQMGLVRIGSHTVQPIPPGAYPHRGILGKWQLEWPWIVGIVSSQPMPGPPSWEIWAGNVRTGASLILDSVGRGPAPRSPQIDFSLNDGRVAWDVDAIAGPGESRIALYNLNTIWTFHLPAKATAIMRTVTTLGGGYAVVQLMPMENAARVRYQVWQLPGSCGGSVPTG